MWAFGLQELQPSFPPSLGKDQVHPAVDQRARRKDDDQRDEQVIMVIYKIFDPFQRRILLLACYFTTSVLFPQTLFRGNMMTTG